LSHLQAAQSKNIFLTTKKVEGLIALGFLIIRICAAENFYLIFTFPFVIIANPTFPMVTALLSNPVVFPAELATLVGVGRGAVGLACATGFGAFCGGLLLGGAVLGGVLL